MGNRKQRRPGPQDHAEGDHGGKTRRRIVEQLQSRPREQPEAERLAAEHRTAAVDGKRRLVQDRQQHDEAEKNSERGQLAREE